LSVEQDGGSRPEQAAGDDVRARAARLVAWLDAGVVGRDDLIERLVIGLIVGGHILIEGAPGLAKTRSAKRLADGVDCAFRRIQCTPDLLPADITGTMVFRQDAGTFEFVPGPIFHNLILVDEINRAPPKVQSALLEAMGEGQVTVAGTTRVLEQPFLVVATQNPFEHEGTYPLPEAQKDRFLLNIHLDYPDEGDERAILDLVEAEARQATPATRPTAALNRADVAALAALAREVHMAAAVKDYVVRLVMATRGEGAGAERARDIEHPASPRATIALAAAARAKACLDGRDFVLPDDVHDLAQDVLSHRIAVTYRAEAEGRDARSIVAALLTQVPVT